MNGLILSKHAKTRSNQRGVRKHDLEVIIEFGKKEHSRAGSMSYFMTRKTCEVARRAMGPASTKLNDNIRSKAVIVSEDGTVITVIIRTRRKYS